MVDTHQYTSMSTAEFYANRAEAVDAAALEKARTEGATTEEAKTAAHAADMAAAKVLQYFSLPHRIPP